MKDRDPSLPQAEACMQQSKQGFRKGPMTDKAIAILATIRITSFPLNPSANAKGMPSKILYYKKRSVISQA